MPYPVRPVRYTTYIPVIVTQEGQAQSGYIVDINAYGACLIGVRNLRPDDSIMMRGVVEANAATVRWQANDRLGVYFEKPIPPQYLSMLRWRDEGFRAMSAIAEARVS